MFEMGITHDCNTFVADVTVKSYLFTGTNHASVRKTGFLSVCWLSPFLVGEKENMIF